MVCRKEGGSALYASAVQEGLKSSPGHRDKGEGNSKEELERVWSQLLKCGWEADAVGASETFRGEGGH